MRSKVISLWDYTQYQLPEELTKWRVREEEIRQKLEAISKSHAQELEGEVVQIGDSISCHGESNIARWNKEPLLFFPGRNLVDPTFENACLGHRLGDTVTVTTPEGEVKLTVNRIIRRQAMPISDTLVKLENIDGVQALDDYTRWYRETTEAERRSQLLRSAAGQLQNLLLQNSQLEIDQEEAREFCQDMVDSQFKAMGGMDNMNLVLLDEDVLNPTEVGVKKKLLEMRLESYPAYVLCTHIVEALAGLDAQQVCAEGWKTILEMNQELKTEEDVRAYAGTSLPKEFAIQNAASQFLRTYVEQFMEA